MEATLSRVLGEHVMLTVETEVAISKSEVPLTVTSGGYDFETIPEASVDLLFLIMSRICKVCGAERISCVTFSGSKIIFYSQETESWSSLFQGQLELAVIAALDARHLNHEVTVVLP